jgi:hypothetical protein
VTMKQMGEIVVDHRASPGLPEDIARLSGYDPKLCREGKMYEAATLTCAHCKGVVVKNPFRIRDRHHCVKCSFHYICDGCAFKASLPDYTHTPFEKKVELIIALEQQGSPMKLLIP